jgi:hypothetical protein
MGHTYGSVNGLKNFIRDLGETKLGSNNDELLLSFLEDGARSIDAYCERTDPQFPMSGFGPRIGTNRYDGVSGSCLQLGDDLLSITSVTVRDSPTGTTRTLTDETDFFKRPYDRSPYRELFIHEDSSEAWGTGTRANDVAGKWGHQDERETLGTLTAAVTTTTATTVIVSVAAEPGQTLYIDSEQLYVTAVSGTSNLTATVKRGANGTTAATHLNAAAVQYFAYPPSVVITNYRLAHRRWKTRDAGADGSDGGGSVPVQPGMESERSILARGVWMYRFEASL